MKGFVLALVAVGCLIAASQAEAAVGFTRRVQARAQTRQVRAAAAAGVRVQVVRPGFVAPQFVVPFGVQTVGPCHGVNAQSFGFGFGF